MSKVLQENSDRDINSADEILTEVTTIAAENKKGAGIKVPNQQQLVNNAMQTVIVGLRRLNVIYPQLKARAKVRALNAILDLPTAGIPVLLKTELEKEAFKVGQMVINARFLLTQHFVNEEMLKHKAEAEQLKGTNNGTESK